MRAANTKFHLSVSRAGSEDEPLKTIIIFCGIGLLTGLLFASYDFDFGAAFL